jgi:hypothetical protein
MRIDELELVCREAATSLVSRTGRPLPPTLVLPLPESTRVVSMPDFPDDDAHRLELLSRFAEEEMRPVNAPCYGFVAEAVAADDDGNPMDVIVLVYGARNHHPLITAAPLDGDEVGAFTEPESVEPTAFPFLVPVQRAVDAAAPPDAMPLGGS